MWPLSLKKKRSNEMILIKESRRFHELLKPLLTVELFRLDSMRRVCTDTLSRADTGDKESRN